MDYETFECLGTLAIIAIAAGGWLYNKIKTQPPRTPPPPSPPPTPPGVAAHQPIATPSQPARGRWLALSIASAAAAYAAVVAGSLVAGVWIAVRPGMPADMGEGMGYAAGLFICVAGPFISVLAGGLSAVVHTLVKELQARDLPLGAHLLFGAVVGVVCTTIPAILLSANTCTAGLLC